MSRSPQPARPFTAGHLLVPLGAALALWPAVTPAMALVGGLAVALTAGNPYGKLTRANTKRLLAASVVGLGAGMNLLVVARAGAHGVLYTVVGIGTALALGMLLARLLKVTGTTGLLISVGTAICGGSAIAAVVPVVRAQEHETSVSMGTVFLLNAVALVLFPPIGHALGLTQEQFGLWAALAIHDTSSVVGAGAQYGPKALEIATTVKLARALWIGPVALAIGAWMARKEPGTGGKARPSVPGFIIGFIAAAALVTFVPVLMPAGKVVATVAKQLLVLTLFFIGANLTPDALKQVGARPLAQGLALWIAMASLSLGAILLHLAT